jgi:hypothetical protein
VELCPDLRPVGIPCTRKIQAFLSWFGRARLLPEWIASRPTGLDFIGNGMIARVPDELIEGAVNR